MGTEVITHILTPQEGSNLAVSGSPYSTEASALQPAAIAPRILLPNQRYSANQISLKQPLSNGAAASITNAALPIIAPTASSSSAPSQPAAVKNIEKAAAPSHEKLRYLMYGVRIFLSVLTFVQILINFILVTPFFILQILWKTLCYGYMEFFGSTAEADKAYEELKNLFPNFWSLLKNIFSKSLNAAKQTLDPHKDLSSCTRELLNLLIDVNGEIRNTLSLLGVTGVISSTLLGLTLGPFRIFQGLLVITLSIITIQKINKELENPNLLDVERKELELAKKTYSIYLAIGILWAVLGSMQVILTAVCPLGAPIWAQLASSIVLFVLFDIGFITISAFYIKQSLFIINNYLSPIQTSISEIKAKLEEIHQIKAQELSQKNPARKQELLRQKENKFKELLELLKNMLCIGKENVDGEKNNKEILKRFFSDETIKYLEEITLEQLTGADGLKSLKYHLMLMENNIEANKDFHMWVNILLCSSSQIAITSSGSPWDASAMLKYNNPPSSSVVDATGAALWIGQNDVCIDYDDPGYAETLASKNIKVKEISNQESQRSIFKVYVMGILLYMFSAFITSDIIGAPSLS